MGRWSLSELTVKQLQRDIVVSPRCARIRDWAICVTLQWRTAYIGLLKWDYDALVNCLHVSICSIRSMCCSENMSVGVSDMLSDCVTVSLSLYYGGVDAIPWQATMHWITRALSSFNISIWNRVGLLPASSFLTIRQGGPKTDHFYMMTYRKAFNIYISKYTAFLSGIRLIFWRSPYLNILYISSEKWYYRKYQSN